jgi:hypothetical protein
MGRCGGSFYTYFRKKVSVTFVEPTRALMRERFFKT